MSSDVPNVRGYRHEACGEITEVDGGYLNSFCNPFNGLKATRCATCGDAFALSEFACADTQERITTMRNRHEANVPGWARALMSDGGCLASVLAGIATGVAAGLGVNALTGWQGWLGWVLPALGAMGGLVAGMMFFGGVISPFVMRTCLGVSDWRELK